MRLKWFCPRVVILAGLVLLFPGKTWLVPDHLTGVWTTAAPKYADRFLEITRVSIIFGTGGDNIYVNFITDVEETVGSKGTDYTLHFQDLQELKGTAYIHYDPAKGVIRLKNQRRIEWTKEKAKAQQ